MTTEWSIFHEMNVNDAAESVTDYIKFCVVNVIPHREINIPVYPNNKLYKTKNMKDFMNRKKELNCMLRDARNSCKDTIEQNFHAGNS